MSDQAFVSISDNTDIGEGWRVRAFVLPASWNAVSRTLVESRFDTEREARIYAADLAEKYKATIL